MTGISARETMRSSRRLRPQATGQSTAIAPPVLFRLPPVALPNGDTPQPHSTTLGDTSRGATTPGDTARPSDTPIASNLPSNQSMAGTKSNGVPGTEPRAMVAGTNSMPGSSMPNLVPGTESGAKVAGTESAAATQSVDSKATLVASKNRGQQLLNTLIALLLLVALVVITWVSVKQPHRGTEAEIVQSDDTNSKSALDSLSQLEVPKVETTAGDMTTTLAKDNSVDATSKSPEGADKLKSTASKSSSRDQVKVEDSMAGTLSGLDLASPSNSPAPVDLASKSSSFAPPSSPSGNTSQGSTSSLPTATVSLGAPTPMPSATSLTAQSSSPTLPLSTPRYETVSGPSAAAKSVFEASSGRDNASTLSGSTDSKSDGASNSSTGSSPSLWEGARTTSVPETQAGGLTISRPMSAEISMSPAVNSSTNSTSNTAMSGAASTPVASSSSVPGVTVGGGLKEPGNISETQTPNLDIAKLSQQYVEYSRQKSLTGTPTSQPVNSYQLQPQDARQNIPTGTNSYTQNYAATAPSAPQIQAPGGGPINSYAQAGMPYGVTGGTTTPYVRNAPGTVPQSTPATLASGPTQPTMGLPSYQATAPQAGYAVPPRAGAATAPYTANSTATGAGVMSGANGYGSAPSAGYPNTAYPPATSPQPGYSQPGYSQPTNRQPGYTQPGYTQPGTNQPMYSQPTGPQAGYAQPGYAQPAYAQPGLMQSSGGTMSASVPPRNVMPVNNLYPGGQAPAGLIGQAGFATAPTGDFTPTPPMPVTGTVGFGTSSPSNMGTLQMGR